MCTSKTKNSRKTKGTSLSSLGDRREIRKKMKIESYSLWDPFVLLNGRKIKFSTYTEMKLNIGTLLLKSNDKKMTIFYKQKYKCLEFCETWILSEKNKPKRINKTTFFVLTEKHDWLNRKKSKLVS